MSGSISGSSDADGPEKGLGIAEGAGTGPGLTARRAAWFGLMIEQCLGWIGAMLLLAMLCTVLAGVVLRYVFHTGFIGLEDAGIWLNIALIAAGAPLTLAGPLSMRIDVVTARLDSRSRFVMSTLADSFSLLTGLLLIKASNGIVAMLGGTSPTLGLPEWVRFSFLGMSGLCLIALLALHRIGEGRFIQFLAACVLGITVWFVVSRFYVETGLPPSLFLALSAACGLAAGAPMAHAFMAASFVAVMFGGNLTSETILTSAVSGMSKFLLLAIPLFLLTGCLFTASGIARRLVAFAGSLVGHRRGGLAQTTLLTGTLFSGASGSSVANAVFSAATFQPELVRHGYPPERAAAIIATASVLDNVIPPSIAFLILATATNLSVGSLLTGGLFAGLLMAGCLAIAIHLTTRHQTGTPAATAVTRVRTAFSALPAFGLGLIVVFGIRMGIVTTTEAAALAAFYTLVMAVFSRERERSLAASFTQAAGEAAAIGFLIGSAGPFAFQIAVDGISGQLVQAVQLFGNSGAAVMLMSVAILLLAGLVLDIGAAILLLGPMLLPVAMASGIDPIGFGVILVVTLMLGGLTPPVGMLVLVVGGVTGIPATALFKATLPYLAALLAAVFILCFYTLMF